MDARFCKPHEDWDVNLKGYRNIKTRTSEVCMTSN